MKIQLYELTPEELLSMIRTVVKEEMQVKFDRPITRKEVAAHFGVSLMTVDKWIRKGEIRRINPEGGHPRFSFSDIMKFKDKR